MRRSLKSALLILETVTFLIAAAFSLSIYSAFRNEVFRRYRLRLASDLVAIEALVKTSMQGYEESFSAFSARPAADPSLFTYFQDIYEVDSSLHLSLVRKRRAGSALFPGYDLSRGILGSFLGNLPEGPIGHSPIVRALEDERPSLYLATRWNGRILVGRVVLDTLVDELARVATYGGSKIAIADAAGFILMGSSTDMPSPLPADSESVVTIGGSDYLYARRDSSLLNGQVAIFEPAEGLVGIVAPMSLAFGVLLAVLGLLLLAKVAYAIKRILGPIARFSRAIDSWTVGSPEPLPPEGIRGFEEVEALYTTYIAKAAEIRRINEDLEGMVAARTTELSRANAELAASNDELGKTVDELEHTTELLLLSEKMAVIGRLSTGIAHDLNTPLAAIRSSSGTIGELLDAVFPNFPDLARAMTLEERRLFQGLLSRATPGSGSPGRILAGAEARSARAVIEEALNRAVEKNGPPAMDPELAADDLVDIGIDTLCANEAEAFVRSGRSAEILGALTAFAGAIRAARFIGETADRASSIVASLKTWAYVERDQPGLVGLRSEIETIIALYRSRFGHGIDLEEDLSDPGFVFGSAERLNRVWVNMIDNALDAMGDSGLLTLRLRRLWERDHEWVEVSVGDSGPGIPPEIGERVFNAAFTTKPRGRGSGLGLDLCKRIVELHGGRIYFESSPAGTTFFVRLRAAPPGTS